jgi:hypothetical protein
LSKNPHNNKAAIGMVYFGLAIANAGSSKGAEAKDLGAF